MPSLFWGDCALGGCGGFGPCKSEVEGVGPKPRLSPRPGGAGREHCISAALRPLRSSPTFGPLGGSKVGGAHRRAPATGGEMLTFWMSSWSVDGFKGFPFSNDFQLMGDTGESFP